MYQTASQYESVPLGCERDGTHRLTPYRHARMAPSDVVVACFEEAFPSPTYVVTATNGEAGVTVSVARFDYRACMKDGVKYRSAYWVCVPHEASEWNVFLMYTSAIDRFKKYFYDFYESTQPEFKP